MSAASNDPALWTLSEALTALKRKRVSSLELTKACLARIERIAPKLNAFLSVDAEAALKAARAADRARAKGDKLPLLGIPLAHKDMFARKGRTMSRGARQSFAPDVEDATVIARLAAAGALHLGPLHMNEFAFGPTGHNVHDGPARNAWDVTRITGGSSSGSATSVAARLIYGALGSDTGGSVRMPAHFCGVTGLKTSYGRVSRAGAMPLSFTLDTIGPLARSAEDAAWLLSVIAGVDPRDATVPDIAVPKPPSAKAPAAGMTIGVPDAYYNEGLDPSVAKVVEDTLATFKSLKVKIKPVKLPDQRRVNAACQVVIGVEATAIHKSMLIDSPEKYGAQVRNRLQNGFGFSGVEYVEAMRFRSFALAEYLAATKGCDAILVPTCPTPAPTIEETDVGGAPGAEAIIQQITRYTRPANILGLPSLTIPCGFSEDGMPIGLQLMGAPFAEATLLALGGAFQGATDYHLRIPPVD
ncbi:amidase [Terrarubrum flagellatum]|uniref:amidase n=1 Tax=Terrirubrum flagellatum TaxID=2895980 RepID=UPI003144E806